MTDKEKKDVTLGEKVLNWAKAMGIVLPLVGAAIVSVLGWFKSDDAQGDVASLIRQLGERVAKQERVINAQSEKLEKMARRMIYFQGHQEGFSAGKLYFKVESTEDKLAQCVATQVKRARVKPSEVKSIISTALQKKRPPPAPAPPPMADGPEQTIPRLYPRPFKKGK